MASVSALNHDFGPQTPPLIGHTPSHFSGDAGATLQRTDEPLCRADKRSIAQLEHQRDLENATDSLEPDGLPVGTRLLRDQYEIEKRLDAGGFGITYLARDSLDRKVVIKECFPEMLCIRCENIVNPRSAAQRESFRSVTQHFLKEARRLAKLQHPNIVDVHQVFEENGTAYLAMEYIDGVDLLSLLEDGRGELKCEVLQKALCDTLDALVYIHGRGILHRDISPDNIMIDKKGRVTLIDFGAARDNFLRHDRALTALLAVKDGYSPHEFYLEETDQQASSDLYSLAATFYHLISGEIPPDSQRRLSALASGKLDPFRRLSNRSFAFSNVYLETIDTCLSISQKDRLQSAEEWLRILKSEAMPINHSAVAPADISEKVVTSIAALVEATNKDVEEACEEPDPEDKHAKEEHIATAQRSEKQLVDLFGNPIDDVEAWMREQDNLISENDNAACKNSEQNDDHITCKGPRALALRPLHTMFRWVFRPARMTDSNLQN